MDSDVLGPFDETGEVSLWLNVTSESEVLGSFLEERSLTNVITASWGTSFSLNDLLSLSCFLNLQQYRFRLVRSEGGQHGVLPPLSRLTIMIDIFYLINNKPTAKPAYLYRTPS